jgi:glutamate 5-kinase
MHQADSRGNQTRYDVACEELTNLQNNLPGKIAVLSFSGETQFCPSGTPYYFGCGTDMAKALKFAKLADVPGIRFILISDGQPDDETETLKVAKTYKNRIDTIFVGPERDKSAQAFLAQLSTQSGGVHITADRAKELASKAQTLLLGG